MNKAIFLDRDGTINIDAGYVYRPQDIILIKNAAKGLKYLQECGFLLIVITNQSGIARGYYSEEEYQKAEEYINDLLAAQGVKLTKTYHCPHLDGNCQCRKPKTGLFHLAAKEFDIDFSKSYAIGDKERDLCICKEEPVEGILLEEKGQISDLLDAARYIIKKEGIDCGKNL